MEFEPDNGYVRKRHDNERTSEPSVNVAGLDFSTTSIKSRQGDHSYLEIVERLEHGWGYNTNNIKPHRVEDITKRYGRVLPSTRCIADAFGVSLYASFEALSELRSRLKIHSVVCWKRHKRGDFLTRLWEQIKAEPIVRSQFFLWQRRFLREH